jgi:hypothetical protein
MWKCFASGSGRPVEERAQTLPTLPPRGLCEAGSQLTQTGKKQRERHKTLLATVVMLALASPAIAFSGNADPRPRVPSGNCEIRDNDPPTNIRSRPKGLIIEKLSNGHIVTVMDQMRDPATGQLWDYVATSGPHGDVPLGWVFDGLVRCY